MRLVRVGESGRERAAVLGASGEVLRLPDTIGDFNASFFERGVADEVRRLRDSGTLLPIGAEPLRFGPPIAKPEKIIGIGVNYRDHARETGAAVPTEPIIFMKAPNSMVGPNDEILIPRGSTKTDWEVELGVVIGQRARYLESPDEAKSVIAGYCVSNDVSEREFQLERGGLWDKGKSAETFNPLGPWLVTANDVPDPQNLRLRLSVNGEVRQDGTTADMIFGVNHLVWYISQFMVLEPGDLINTGTPSGVSNGHDDVPFLQAGDVLELSVDGLGTQRNVLGQA